MGKLFTSVSSLWVLFIPVLSVSKIGIVEMIDDGHKIYSDHDYNVFEMIKQLGELREAGLITQQEFESKKQKLMNDI